VGGLIVDGNRVVVTVFILGVAVEGRLDGHLVGRGVGSKDGIFEVGLTEGCDGRCVGVSRVYSQVR
jgi:hypothetical protein